MKTIKTHCLNSLSFLILSFLVASCTSHSIFIAPGYDPRICAPLLRHGHPPTAAMIWVERFGDLKDERRVIKGSVVSLATETPRPGTSITLVGPGDISGPVITTAGAGQYFIAWQDGSKLRGKVIREDTLATVSSGDAVLTTDDELFQSHSYDLAYDPSRRRVVLVYVTVGGLKSRLVPLERLGTDPTLTASDPILIRTPTRGLNVRLPKVAVPLNGPADTVAGEPFLVVWLEGGQAHGAGLDVNAAPGGSSHFLVSGTSERGCENVACCFDRSTRKYLVLFDLFDPTASTGTVKASTVTLGPGAPAVTAPVDLVSRTAGGEPASGHRRNPAYKLGETADFADWGGIHAGPRPCIFEAVTPLASATSQGRLVYRETKSPLAPIVDPVDHFYAENLAVLPFDAALAGRGVTHVPTGPNPNLKGAGDAEIGRDGQLLIIYEDFTAPGFVRGPVAAAPRQNRLFYPRAPYLWLQWSPW